MKPIGSEIATPIRRTAAIAFALAVCLGTLPASARQNAQQDQNAPQDQAAPRGTPSGPPPSAPADSALPATLTLPAGTVIPVRLTQWLSSDQNHPGDGFSATLDQPLIVNGWVVARRGQSIIGRVAVAEKAGHGKSASRLGVELDQLALVDGQQLPVKTELVQSSTARSQGRDAATVGGTTALGAIIGAVAGGGQGAAIGAAAGLGGGIALVLSTPGRPTVLRPEELLTFRLDEPLNISTERSQVAFRPVSQGDYNRDQDAYAGDGPRRFAGPGPGPGYPPPPYYYGGCYPGAWGCYYPGPAYFYGGYGFGPRIAFFGRGGFRR